MKPTGGGLEELAGTRWLVQTIDGVSVPVYTESVVAFDSSFSISGNGGCNAFAASVEISGRQLRTGVPAVGAGPCGAEVAALQARFFAALEAARSYEPGDAYLVLSDADGHPRLGLSRILPPTQ